CSSDLRQRAGRDWYAGPGIRRRYHAAGLHTRRNAGRVSAGKRRIRHPGVPLKSINIGICGLGTVGYGSYSLLLRNRKELARRVGREVVVSHVGTRRLRPGQDIGATRMSTDVFAVVDDPQVDIVLELMGGMDVAHQLVLRAIANGKHVVTANKALIATHGNEIFAAAAAQN